MKTEIYTPERSAEGLWSNIVAQAEKVALSHIETNFERNTDLMGNLSYHNRLHTLRVKRRVTQILEAVRMADSTLVTPKDIALGQIGALFHDTVQKWEEKDGKRRRFTGKNEEESADMATVFMDRINEEYEEELFTGEDKSIVRDAIHTTIPGFKDGTVTQPRLTPESHIVVKAIAIADVDGCLIDGPRLFLGEGDLLFIEENLDILRALRETGVENLSALQMENFRARMLDWIRSQVRFVEGRQKLIDSDLEGLPEKARKRVNMMLSRGEDSKRELVKLAAIRESLSFSDLVKAYGYDVALY